MRRGEIYWADLVPRSGSEQTGRRPVIVVSHDAFNETPAWRSVIVVPLSTSEAQAKRGPSVVDLKSGSASKASYAICHQVTTLDRAKLMKKAGVVPPDVMRRVEDGIKAAMDLD